MRKLFVGALSLTLTWSTIVVAEPNDEDVDSANSPELQFIRDPGNLNGPGDAPQVGTALLESLELKHAVRIELTIKCQQYVLALTVFEDGSFKATDMGDEPVNREELASAQAALPMLTVIDTGCQED